MEKKVQRLEAIVAKLANDSEGLPTEPHRSGFEAESLSTSSDREIIESQGGDVHRENGQTTHWDIVMDLDSGPGAIPGFYISDTPSTESRDQDFITRGVISPEKAQEYFDKYKNRLDHFPYRILGDHDSVTLESIRSTSPLLAAAVCTVGALHSASDDFDLCYREFISISATQSFSRANTVDDVRALCIGAFWLSDISWTLVGTAVRIATELQLHKSIVKALQGDRQHYLRSRLYYLVYACDHHFSVAFGRPPMTRECEAVRNVRKFLGCEHATEDDARLVSQVLRWSICSNIFDTFGVDVERPITDSEVPRLRRFSIALDSLRAEWAERFIPNVHVGNYPKKGVGLQYHFAKLYLCSHAFRGFKSDQGKTRSHDIAMELDEIANCAFLAALSILRAVVSDTEIQSYLDGLPTYFDTMIAFAAVFLLKVSTKFPGSVQMDVLEVQRLIGTLVSTLRRVTSTMHPRHLLVNITNGIDRLLQRCGLAAGDGESSAAAPAGQEQIDHDSGVPQGEFNWAVDDLVDPYFLGEYDFLNFLPE